MGFLLSMAKASHANQTKGCLVTWLQDPTEVSAIAKTGTEKCDAEVPCFCPAHSDPHCIPPQPGLFPWVHHLSWKPDASIRTWWLYSPTYSPSLSPSSPAHQNFSLSAAATILAIVISCLVHYTVLTSQPPPHLFNQSNHFMVEAGHACSLLRILQWLPITLRTQDNILRIK